MNENVELGNVPVYLLWQIIIIPRFVMMISIFSSEESRTYLCYQAPCRTIF
jgi:hypothetical protein